MNQTLRRPFALLLLVLLVLVLLDTPSVRGLMPSLPARRDSQLQTHLVQDSLRGVAGPPVQNILPQRSPHPRNQVMNVNGTGRRRDRLRRRTPAETSFRRIGNICHHTPKQIHDCLVVVHLQRSNVPLDTERQPSPPTLHPQSHRKLRTVEPQPESLRIYRHVSGPLDPRHRVQIAPVVLLAFARLRSLVVPTLVRSAARDNGPDCRCPRALRRPHER